MDIHTFQILDVPISAVTLDQVVSFLIQRAGEGQKSTIIFRDVHGIVRCQDDPEFLRVHKEATLVCPDGMPVVWLGRKRGFNAISRVYGPDLMRSLMNATSDGSHTHFLYGGNVGVAEKLKSSLENQFPGVAIIGTYSPPFGPLADDELTRVQESISSLKPDFFWVGLSTPKQEFFMNETISKLDTTVMLGVGAAFDYLSGEVKEPPAWLRKSGFQWLARICQEPRRLAGRYVKTVPRFIYLLFLNSLKK